MMQFIFRLFGGLVLAGLVGFSFHRSRSQEDGEGTEPLFSLSDHPTKHTEVLMLADSLVWFFPFLAVIAMLFAGVKEGLLDTGFLTINFMITFSLYCPILYFCLPYLRRHFSAKACATLWIVPAFLLYNVNLLFRSQVVPLFQFYIPRKVMLVLMVIWGAGFILLFGYYVIMDLIFSRRIRKSSMPVTDEAALRIWKEVKEELEIYEEPKLLRCSLADGPFAMGKSKSTRAMILPEKSYSESQLHMIFSHELHHLQRGDVNTKIFLNFMTALCWFNPLIWIAVRKAVEDLELSCDEIVAAKMDPDERRQYAALLLGNVMPRHGFTTCLSASGSVLRYRLGRIVKPMAVRSGTLLVTATAFACFLCFGLFSVTMEQGTAEELLPENAWNFSSICLNMDDSSDSEAYFALVSDENSLIAGSIREAVANVRIQKIQWIGHAAQVVSGQHLTLDESDGFESVSLYDNILECRDQDGEYSYYKVISDVDWDAIQKVVKQGNGDV